MVDPHPGTEDATKPFRQLGSQDNLGQHEQNLFPLFDCLLHKMDIDFRLAAASYAVKEANVVCLPLFRDALHRLLLDGSQGRGTFFLMYRFCPFYGFGVGLEDAFLAKLAQDGVRTVRFLQQSLLFDWSFKTKKKSQQSLLFRGFAQAVECFVKTRLVVVGFGKPHTGYGLGLICATYFLLHPHSPFLKEVFHGGQDALDACLFLQTQQRLLGLFTEGSPYFFFVWREGRFGFPALVQQNGALALQFQARWQRSFENIAKRAEIILGKPFP